jgi:hypothetical protein
MTITQTPVDNGIKTHLGERQAPRRGVVGVGDARAGLG